MSLQAEPIALEASDGARSELRSFRGDVGARAPIVIAPAMGVAAAYYDPFASALAARGFDVFVKEHRGTGTSSVDPRRVDWGYETMLRADYAAALARIRAIRPDRAPSVVGHSLGGQLAALYAGLVPDAFEKLAFVACGSVDFRGWRRRQWPRIFVGTQMAGVIGRAVGYFPGDRLGFGGRQPKTLISDWSRQARTGRYAPTGASVDYEAAMRSVRLEILGISIEGDDLAPRAALDRLCAKLPAATILREHVRPDWAVKSSNDAHFRWARNDGVIVERLAAFFAR